MSLNEADFVLARFDQDCLYGIWKALKAGLLNLEDFDIDEYCFYERVE